MRIVFLTQWFAPEPHFKGLPFAHELARRGHEVVVLTGFPNYPGGKLYPGYALRPWQREVVQGIQVVRVPLYPSHDRSSIGRILNYTSFAVSAALAATVLAEVDVAYVYHPPATIGLPALVLQWLRGIPCVYDVQDLWPDTLAATGMLSNAAALSIAGAWSNFVYRQMRHVVVLSPGFRARLLERGVARNRMSVILNWSPDAGNGSRGDSTADEETQLPQGGFNVVFAGNMGAAQGLETVLAAAARTAQENNAINFIFVGGGMRLDALREKAAAMQLQNVKFLGRRPPSAMPAIYAQADVLLVHLKADPLFEITIPSKTQTYLAAGRPVIMAVRGDATELIKAASAGICCAPEDPDELASAVLQLVALPIEERHRLGANGREFYDCNLDMNKQVGTFERLFAGIVAERDGSPAI